MVTTLSLPPSSPPGTFSFAQSLRFSTDPVPLPSTFVGALGAYPVGDYFGRRLGIMLYLVLFCLGVALQVSPLSFHLRSHLLIQRCRLEVKTLPPSSSVVYSLVSVSEEPPGQSVE